MDAYLMVAMAKKYGILYEDSSKSSVIAIGRKADRFQFRSLRNPDPAVFLCASAAWGITTVFILERYRHHPYRYHFLVAGITISVLLAALTTTLEELPSYLAITYAPLWISVAMIFSITLHWLVLGHRK